MKVINFHKKTDFSRNRVIDIIYIFLWTFILDVPSFAPSSKWTVPRLCFPLFFSSSANRTLSRRVRDQEGGLTLKIKYELVLSHVTSHTYVSMYRMFQKHNSLLQTQILCKKKTGLVFCTSNLFWYLTKHSSTLSYKLYLLSLSII